MALGLSGSKGGINPKMAVGFSGSKGGVNKKMAMGWSGSKGGIKEKVILEDSNYVLMFKNLITENARTKNSRLLNEPKIF